VPRIYLDHNATTPMAPAVAEAMTRVLREGPGNASSIHLDGQRAKAAVDEARTAVAHLLGASPRDVVFTSGGTESDNLAIRGCAEAAERSGRRHLVASSIEHEAVLNTVRHLERRGWEATWLPVGPEGIVTADALAAALREDTALVSVMLANNEIGTLQPVAELARAAHARGALFHTDAVQAIGKLPVDVTELDVDLLSLSAHKFNGPQGVGALWIRPGTPVVACQTGGRQERNRRAGTENVAGIAGLGVAASLAREKLDTEPARLATLRDRLEAGLLAAVPGATVNGARDRRVPNTTNIGFDGVDAEALVIALDLEGLAVSTGSACSSGTLEPSHVLKAMGLGTRRAQQAIRFSLGTTTTAQEIERTLEIVPRVVARVRAAMRVPARG
jgi:cysteine desulfurase